jgi:uncharacterized protein
MPSILCEHCTAACCRYIALPIDTPETRTDYDDIRWFLLHESVSVFVEDGDWYIAFVTPCQHIQPDHRCGIYETRPRVCRQYTTDDCDYHSGDYGWEQHFAAPEHLDAYVQEHADEIDKKTRRKKARGKTGRGRTGLKAVLGRRRVKTHQPTAATTDRHGTPLPVLPWAVR